MREQRCCTGDTAHSRKYYESNGLMNMNEIEKEYQEFVIKLIDKANEVQKDFEKLSPENKERVMKDAKYWALIKLGESIK